MIYVTSFNKHLYDSTGKQMIKSFQQHQPDDKLFVLTEGIDVSEGNVTCQSIDDDKFLNDWLKANHDIIPEIFGGSFVCDCKDKKSKSHWSGHKPKCAAGGFRRRACHWFRKVTAWKIAAEKYDDSFVWIDCDSVFLKNLPEKLVRKYMQACCIRFHVGRLRTHHKMGIESGVIIFDLENGGKDIVDAICSKFVDGTFRSEKRWDDAWIITVIAQEAGLISVGDLCPHSNDSSPINTGPLSPYITHNKGIHWKQFGVNTKVG